MTGLRWFAVMAAASLIVGLIADLSSGPLRAFLLGTAVAAAMEVARLERR